MSGEPQTWMKSRFATLDALYRRFGRGGLKDQSVADIRLWLSEKELRFRDMGKRLSVEQQAASRQLELEILDLTSYLKSVGMSLTEQRPGRHSGQPIRNRSRDFDMDR